MMRALLCGREAELILMLWLFSTLVIVDITHGSSKANDHGNNGYKDIGSVSYILFEHNIRCLYACKFNIYTYNAKFILSMELNCQFFPVSFQDINDEGDMSGQVNTQQFNAPIHLITLDLGSKTLVFQFFDY